MQGAYTYIFLYKGTHAHTLNLVHNISLKFTILFDNFDYNCFVTFGIYSILSRKIGETILDNN